MLRRILLTASITTVPMESVEEAAGKDNSVLYLIFGMAAIFLILVSFVVFQEIYKRTTAKKRQKKYKRMDQFFISVYQGLSAVPMIKRYMEKISYRYRFISPCDSVLIARRSVVSCTLSWFLCGITFWFVYLRSPSLNTIIIAVIGIYAVDSIVVGSLTKHYKVRILEEMEEKLLANVIHNYYVNYRVDDAVYRSMDFLSLDMKVAATQIYELLLADEKESALQEYYENVPNKYLRAFVSQCMTIMERGDEEINGKRLFIRNIECLQREINIEVEKMKKLNMEFAGVLIAVVAPIFFIDFIKHFAVNMKENMAPFYFGKLGFLCDIGIILLTLCVYTVMKKSAEFMTFHHSTYVLLHRMDHIPVIKKAMDNYTDKYASRQERLKRELRDSGSNITPRLFVLRSFLIAGMVLVLGIGVTNYMHYQSRADLLTADTKEMEVLTSAAKNDQYETMGQAVEQYTRKYVLGKGKEEKKKTPETVEEMTEILRKDGNFYNNLVNEALAKEILTRITKYRNEYFSFMDLLICLLLSIFSYYLPLLLMKYNSAASKDAMEDEVNQFNASISMLMYNDGITVKQLLEEMESFAMVFKQSLRICLNNYGSGDMEALEELMEREPYEPFVRIVENLMRCDDMPVDQAFHEIDTDRDGYLSKRKLANEKSIKKRVRRAMLLAMIPLLLLLAYGVFPPLSSSMNEINLMMGELNSSSW